MAKMKARCEQVSRPPDQCCGVEAGWYCVDCERRLCAYHASWHRVMRCRVETREPGSRSIAYCA